MIEFHFSVGNDWTLIPMKDVPEGITATLDGDRVTLIRDGEPIMWFTLTKPPYVGDMIACKLQGG